MDNVIFQKQILDTKVKICGIKRADEVAILNDYPVSYAGFIFAKSKRRISKEKAKILIKSLRSDIKPIGVFVNPSFPEMIEIIQYCNLYGVQLHGDVAIDFELAKHLKRLIISKEIKLQAIWKSISVGKGLGDYSKNLDQSEENDESKEMWPHLREAHFFEHYADAILFDTYTKSGATGGTGEIFNWDMIKDHGLKKPVILAGGLNPENIGDAIKTLHPSIVDLNSGLEEKYIKQRDKVDQLFETIINLEIDKTD